MIAMSRIERGMILDRIPDDSTMRVVTYRSQKHNAGPTPSNTSPGRP